jgi:3-oxoacyl-[acyl-carrier-protein] synthase-3
MVFARLITTGAALPLQELSNVALAANLETSDEWIQERTGICSRHIVSGEETTETLAIAAAQQALTRSQWAAASLELIIVATCTPSYMFPSTACLVQRALGIEHCIAFDMAAACSGFMYALHTAEQFIRAGQVQRALVIGSETMSKVVDWQDRSTCILFGDGAGAVLLEASNTPGIILSEIGTQPAPSELLYLKNAAFCDSNIGSKEQFLAMQGQQVFKIAVTTLSGIAEHLLLRAGYSAEQLDWLIPHQANSRIIRSTAQKLGLPMEKVILTLDKHANTSAASVPIALDSAVSSGKIRRGHRFLLEAFGGGLTWGAALIEY